ncbi:MAG: hypothetical protein H0W53_23075, partial [Acidobacteria bacterium]|nr:hypothetical protein [Acidobacteriota bacterium]
MTTVQRITATLNRILDVVTAEADKNPAFASSLEKALGEARYLEDKPQPKRPHRRA